MKKKLYKYIGPSILNLAFSNAGFCSFKCSLPRDFNDPYELFLALDFNQSPELLAFYQSSIGEIPQQPTTCFSLSPTIIPMWAHYAESSKGFVLEIDVNKLLEHLSDYKLSNIDYRDSANEIITKNLKMAHGTGKPRHSYIFWQSIFHAAYFTKQTCWAYEKEVRLVVKPDHINQKNLLFVPSRCITSIIAGSHTLPELKMAAQNIAKDIVANYYELHIGRSLATPYFLDTDKITYIFDEHNIVEETCICSNCQEPLLNKEDDECAWCNITNEMTEDANWRNPMNILGDAGLLTNYLEAMNSIRNRED